MKNLTGQKFGRLECVDRQVVNQKSHYICVCDCGELRSVLGTNLKNGNTRSCGCLRKEVCREYCTKPLLTVIGTQVLNYYKRNARLRGIPWGLTTEHFVCLIQNPCHYYGEVGVNTTTTTHASATGRSGRTMRNNGVDRVDNDAGYVVGNVVPCCKHCNRAKLAMTRDEFLSWVKRVYHHNLRRSPRG